MTDVTLPREVVEPMFLLTKRGLYYRPNAMGYTGIKDKAGRYSRAEAETHVDPESGVDMIAEAEAPDFSPKCYDDLAREHLEMKLAEARAEIAALAAVRVDLEPVAWRLMPGEVITREHPGDWPNHTVQALGVIAPTQEPGQGEVKG
jgi:hypothetical protein